MTVKIDAVGDQGGDEEGPLKGAERSSGLGGARWATVVCALLELVAVAVAADIVGPIRNGCIGGERGKGREPENDAEAFESEVRVLVVGGWEPECGDLDVAEEEKGPNEGENADAVSGIEDYISAASIGGQCEYEDSKKL